MRKIYNYWYKSARLGFHQFNDEFHYRQQIWTLKK